MDERFIINDNRTIKNFKEKTFSGFKKNEVINTVLKSIEGKKIENACNWTTECILSGYSLILWEKLLNFSSKIIHINNPHIPYYLFRKNKIFMNQIERLQTKSKDKYLLLRNSQMIRNLFFDVVTTLSTSSKTKRYDKYPKMDDNEDFKFMNIQKRLCAPMNILPENIIHFNDPNEIRIIINEIFHSLKNKQYGYDKCCFWILWLIRYEELNKKKKYPFNIDERDIEGVPKKYQGNIVWVFWETILEEMKLRKNKNITKHITALYELYKCNYSIGKRKKRIPILLNAVGYLTHTIHFQIPLRNNFPLFIQVQSNVNKMFGLKKINEIKTKSFDSFPEKPPKKENINVEIVQDKLSIFNEVDKIISNQ